jgi:hypothetical protein
VVAWFVLFWQERAAKQRLRAEHRKGLRRHGFALDVRRFLAVGQRDAITAENGDILKNLILCAPIREVGIRDRRPVGNLARALSDIVGPECYQILRLVERQRPQEHGVEDTEYGAVRADSERESQDDDSGKEGLFEKGAQRMTNVMHGKLIQA